MEIQKTRRLKMGMLLAIDIILINIAYILAYYIRFSFTIEDIYLSNYVKHLPLIITFYLIPMMCFKMYRSIWHIAGFEEFSKGVIASLIGAILNFSYTCFVPNRVPRRVTIIAGILVMLFTVGVRLSFRAIRRVIIYKSDLEHSVKKGVKRENVLIIGAGFAGNLIINEMRNQKNESYKVVGFIDDNKEKVGTFLSGVKVLGSREYIEKIVREKQVALIIIAMPGANGEDKKAIINICNKTKVRVKIIPGMFEIIDGNINLNAARDVDLRDLLGRDEVKLNKEDIKKYLNGKVVLVTGGGGSIGSELCRQIAAFNPKLLLILDIYENNAYDLQNELNRKFPRIKKEVLIASVRDEYRLDYIFRKYKPEVVFHAAAHKHVPLMEVSPEEAIKNNVKGTLNTAQCADKYGAQRFVLISTDKAVNPTNVMGATKRMCEMIVQGMDKKSKTEFVAVRFGNVLGSNGSVIPLFKKQIVEGGPVTLTNKNITRYFMLIPEASQLVLQSATYAKGGEIFVLDMGKPVKIYDLAKDLIKLSGYEPNKDIKIEVVGLRPGEKLYEELLMDEEGLENTAHEKIFIGKPGNFDIEVLKKEIDELLALAKMGKHKELRCKIEILVPTYKRLDKGYKELNDAMDEVAAAKSN